MNEECGEKQCGCSKGAKSPQGLVGIDDDAAAALEALIQEERQNAVNFTDLCYIGGFLLLILAILLMMLPE
jgi:hypothetical protein